MELNDHNYETIQFPTATEVYSQWDQESDKACSELYQHIIKTTSCTECTPYGVPGSGVIRYESETMCICNYCGVEYFMSRDNKHAEVLRKIEE